VLDITTTATIRPDMFRQTLKSFTDRMFTNQRECRLILNVDPIGDNADPEEMHDVAKSFFDYVLYNKSATPNFAQACQFCWSETDSEFVFHLEDDWTLSRKINIKDMLFLMKNNKNMMSLRLPKLTLNNINKEDSKNKFISHHKLSLNPTIFRGSFIRNVANNMNITDNPEKQLRKVFKLPKDEIAGIYCGIGNGEYIKHHGREWQKVSKYKKRKGSNFINWERR